MRTPPVFLTSAAVLSAAVTAHSQLPNASQQVDSLQAHRQLEESALDLPGTNAPALYDSETDDVGPQTVVKVKPRRTWIQAFGDEQYFYTDNLFLADHT